MRKGGSVSVSRYGSSMAKITRHGRKRAKERAGIGKGNLQKMASKILREGVTHKECSGDLKRWVTSKYFRNKQANNIRLYGNQCYIFKNETLITVLPIPENLVSEVAKIRRERTTKAKYRLDRKESISVNGFQLFRIIAERNFADVHMGDRGGYIMHTKNLSSEGDCWVYDDARVFGKAVVKENAIVEMSASVDGQATIAGNAVITDDSIVQGKATVCGDVTIQDHSCIRGSAYVCGDGVASNFMCHHGVHEISKQQEEPLAPKPNMISNEERIQNLMEVSFCRSEQEARLLDDWLRTH